jgi:hypothetical protein
LHPTNWILQCQLSENPKSTTGLIFTLSNGPITWKSVRQDCTTLSSTESELNAMSEAVKHAIYLNDLFKPMQLGIDGPITIYSDSQSAIKTIVKHADNFKPQMKHYALKMAHLCESIAASNVRLDYCPSEDMPADALTKSLGPTCFSHLRERMGLIAEPCTNQGVC